MVPATHPLGDDAEEPLAARVARATAEPVEVVPYDPAWPAAFEAERQHLLDCLPPGIVLRVEHFGSTAVPGLAAKPVVDILVEVASLEDVKTEVVPVLENQGYEYFWRPTFGDDGEPFYVWFIKRDPVSGKRTHHIHMVESAGKGFWEHWDRLRFRDFLRTHPETADRYGALKLELAEQFPGDRVAYTAAKTAFISAVMQQVQGNVE